MEVIDEFQYIFQIVLLGDSEVGKTNILSSYLNGGIPSEDLETTLGIDQKSKILRANKDNILVKIVDPSGKEEFEETVKKFGANSNGGFIVYDVSKKASFDNVDKWVKLFREISGENAPLILLGNKSDLIEEREIQTEEGEEKAKKLNIPFYETCAFVGENISSPFKELLNKILENAKKNTEINKNEEKMYTNERENDDDTKMYTNERENDDDNKMYTNERENDDDNKMYTNEREYVESDEKIFTNEKESDENDKKLFKNKREKPYTFEEEEKKEKKENKEKTCKCC